MATYITTVKFTDQGIKGIKDTTKRTAVIKDGAKKMSVKVKDIYWTMGSYDGLLVFEAPDDEAASAFLLQVGSMGNVHTLTTRGFNAAEMDKILAKLSG